MFAFKNANYDLNLIKSYLLPILVNEQDIEPSAIKKKDQSKFGNFQASDVLKFLGWATGLDSFLKAYKTSQAKNYFPYEWSYHPDKTQNTEVPQMTIFTVNFVAVTLLKWITRTMFLLLKSGLTTEQAVVNLKLSKPTPTGIEHYRHLQ